MIVYLLGLLSPFAFALGTVMQQRGTMQTRAREGDPRFLVQMLRRPVWLVGGLITVCAFLLQAAALRYGSLSLIQALQGLGLVSQSPASWCSSFSAGPMVESRNPPVQTGGLPGPLS